VTNEKSDNVSVFINILCYGDVDSDGDVDGSDMASFADAFGSSVGDPNYNPTADFDENGIVNENDLWLSLPDFGCIDCP